MSIDSRSPQSRLAGCSFTHPGRTLAQGLEIVKAMGFSHVDIGVGGGNGHFDPVAVAESPQEYAAAVRADIEASGLQINECFTLNFGPPLNSPNEADRTRTRELFRGLCQFAKAAAARSILLIAGPVHEEIGQQGSIDLAVEACTELVAIAQEHGVLLNIEADCESCVCTPETATELCLRVPGLGLTLDYSHFIYLGAEQARVEQLHQYTRHIHIRQAAPGEIVADVDKGTIDFATVLAQLESSGYSGLYCIEYLSFAPDKATQDNSEARNIAMAREVESLLDNLTN